jgi:Retrotransposon gag protein
MADLGDIINQSKIPDPIKFISNYDGDSKTLHYWLTSVEVVINLYDNVRLGHPAVFAVWLGVIRSKIIGKANDALVLRHVPLAWANIRACLIEYFGDSRDLSTLCQKIPYLRQENKTVEEYYKEISQLSANINQKIVLDPRYDNHVDAVMVFVNEITKNAFIDGLNEPYNLTVRGFRPESLEAAKSAAEEQVQSVLRNRNPNFRQNGNRGKFPQNSSRVQNQNAYANRFQQQQPSNLAQNFQNRSQPQSSNFANQGNFQNRPQAQPNQNFSQGFFRRNTPMEVDSARTRQSAMPMSISRVQNVSNMEQASEEEVDQGEDFEQSEGENFDNEQQDVNFHLVVDENFKS